MQMRQTAQTAPDGTVLAVCEQMALNEGRTFLRNNRASTTARTRGRTGRVSRASLHPFYALMPAPGCTMPFPPTNLPQVAVYIGPALENPSPLGRQPTLSFPCEPDCPTSRQPSGTNPRMIPVNPSGTNPRMIPVNATHRPRYGPLRIRSNATNPNTTPKRQSTLNGNTKHTIQRPAVTPVVSLNGCKVANNPKATSPPQPRMLQTRLANAHNVLGFVSSIPVYLPLLKPRKRDSSASFEDMHNAKRIWIFFDAPIQGCYYAALRCLINDSHGAAGN